ncbi:MAG: RluA family pseudouridine synthase [Elusimicrobia bacterium]|nr:RluA family pseudouridine synthase [Elusimicrobiota bacterium]
MTISRFNNKNLVWGFTGRTRRLDAFVAEKIPVISREFAKKLIKTGMALVNDKINLKPSTLLSPGDEITVKIAEPKMKVDFPKNILIYEDNDILVISKPSGLIAHPNDSNWEKFPDALLIGEESVMSVVLNARPGIIDSKIPRFGLVHRLDRDTSGVMVLAKNRTSMSRISEQFRKRKIIKTYWGLVSGKVTGKTGLIEIPIGRPSGSKKIKAWEYGRHSVTQFKLIAGSEKYALLEIYPRTGRTNQIRVHLAHAGHPIVGETCKFYRSAA